MRILILSPRLPSPEAGPGYQIVYHRIRALLAAGHEVSVLYFTSEKDEGALSALQSDGVKALGVRSPSWLERQVRPSSWRGDCGVSSLYWLYSTDMLRAVGDYCDREHIELVLAEFVSMGVYLYRNPFLPVVRRAISVHRSPMLEALKRIRLSRGPFVAWVWRWRYLTLRKQELALYKSVHGILVLSREEQHALQRLCSSLDIHVVPGGVDTHLYQRPAVPRQNCIVTTGHYDDLSNYDAVMWFLRRVWPRLAREYANLSFQVIGPYPPSSLLTLARRMPRVFVSGWVPDVRPYLSNAKIFVCPQRFGSGMRGKLLEAMSMELPVVATTVGAEGIPIQPGETGFIADTPERFIMYIRLLLEDAALVEKIGRNSRHFVQERFSWDRCGELLLEAVEKTRAA